MIVSLTALIAATALSAETSAAGAAAARAEAPLDDLRVMDALLDTIEADTAPDWLDLQGYAAPDLDEHGPEGHHDPRRGDRLRHEDETRGRTDGGVYGPRKDAGRVRHDRFGLRGGGFVDMPGPRGAGGRIAGAALRGAADGADAAADDAAEAPFDVSVSVSGEAGTAPASEQADAVAAARADAPALRLSYAKVAAPEGPSGDAEVLPTPLPASAFLFAGGMGLLGLSRRRLG